MKIGSVLSKTEERERERPLSKKRRTNKTMSSSNRRHKLWIEVILPQDFKRAQYPRRP